MPGEQVSGSGDGSTQATCRECRTDLDAGYLCDQCDTVEVVSA